MISELRLVNFRSYVDSTFEFQPLTVIIGGNGCGKTNIIEALHFLSTGRSFRSVHDGELIRFGQPFARLASGPLDITLVAGLRVQKQVQIEGKSARLLQVLGQQPTVLFTPTSLGLIDGSPQGRRQFLDILLAQTHPLYARYLLQYQRALKQRNELLHRIQVGQASVDELTLWDDLLVQSSLPVIQARKAVMASMKTMIDSCFHLVSGREHEKAACEYNSSVEKRETAPDNADALSSLFHDRLRERRAAELLASRTLVGPHRDDITFLLNDRLVALYASRGQMRNVVVALKLFEYEHIKAQSGKAPALLLDDVFSEFDADRRKRVLRAVGDAQMICTATDLAAVGRLPARAEVINLQK